MIPPFLALDLVVSSIYGLVFYLIFGRGWLRLGAYWIVGIVGFFIGDRLAAALGLALLNIGPTNLVGGTLVSWASLFLVRARVR